MESKDGYVLSSDGESCLKAQTRSLLQTWRRPGVHLFLVQTGRKSLNSMLWFSL